MPVGNLPGAGYDPELFALLTIDADPTPLERQLGKAQRDTQQKLGQMGRDVDRTGRRMTYVFQNVGYQISDFIVQVGSGTNAFRAFAQQAPQAVQAFAILGGTIGRISIPLTIAITAVSAFAAALLGSKSSAKTVDEQYSALSKTLGELADRYQTAEGAAKGFATARAQGEQQQTLANTVEEIKKAQKEFADAIGQFETQVVFATRGTGLTAQQVEDLRQLGIAFYEDSGRADQFRKQVTEIARSANPEFSKTLNEVTLAAFRAGDAFYKMQEQAELLNAGLDPTKFEALRERAAGLRTMLDTVKDAPPAFTEAGRRAVDLAEAVSKLGLSMAQFEDKPEKFKQDVYDLVAALEASRREKGFETLEKKIRDTQIEAGIAARGPLDAYGRRIKAVSEALSILNLTPEDLKSQPERVRNAVGAWADLAESVHHVGLEADKANAKNERLIVAGQKLFETTREARGLGFAGGGAEAARSAFRGLAPRPELKPLEAVPAEVLTAYDRINATLTEQGRNKERLVELQTEINQALAGQQISEEQAAELSKKAADAASGRLSRIESSSRLPDDIDAANIAAGELSSTLTDVSNLSFESLGAAIASIAQQIAQAALQALIFKAIMGGIGGIGGASGFATTPAGGGGGSTTLVRGIPQFSHGGVFAHGRLATAQHGAVFRRGEMALMTGRVSGAALLEGAGDEAAVPLVTLPSGKLGVGTGGGGGGGSVFNIDARGATPGMQAMIENGVRRALAAAPAYSANAYSRGLVRDERRPPF